MKPHVVVKVSSSSTTPPLIKLANKFQTSGNSMTTPNTAISGDKNSLC